MQYTQSFKIFVFVFFLANLPKMGSTQVVVGQIDVFEQGSLNNWKTGIANDTIITNQNGQLQVKAIGGSGKFGKLLTFNENQWVGDYMGQGITSIKVKLTNTFDPFNRGLKMRIAIGDNRAPGPPSAPVGTWFVSSSPVVVTTASGQVTAIFSLAETALTRAQGAASYNNVLSNVAALRIINATSSFNPRGDDNTLATLLIDDVTACGCFDTPFNETSNGDLSSDFSKPTIINLSGTTMDTITSCQQGNPSDVDYFTVNVPHGSVLSELKLTDFSAEDSSNRGFIGLQAGKVFTTSSTNTTAADLLGGLTYGTAQAGTNILPAMGMLGGSQGFTPPLSAGDYTIWLNQTGPLSYASLQLVLAAAENCPTTLSFNNETINVGTYKAADTIRTMGNSIVANNSTVNFEAGKTILLNAGFQVPMGSTFSANLANCMSAMLAPTLSQTFKQRPNIPLVTPSIALKTSPNPFRSSTSITYQLQNAEKVDLKLYDLSGKLTQTIVPQAWQTAGSYQYNLESTDLNKGMYLLVLTTGRESVTQKLILLD